jgi:two-component system chemotaxis response regulator CheB
VEPLAAIAAHLPSDFPAAIYVAVHQPEGAMSLLAGILDRAGPLAARTARSGEPLQRGTIAVAPRGHHLVLERGGSRVVRGPKINGHRPSIDVLFHSAARSYGARVVGVVLSGALSDGAFGLYAITGRGGGAIVQADAAHRGMPSSALELAAVEAVVPTREIPEALTMLLATGEDMADDEQSVGGSELEAGFDLGRLQQVPGTPSLFRCPDCGGALWELDEAGIRGYACHVGHSFSAESMVDEQGDAVERALRTAVQMLQERAALMGRLAKRMSALGSEAVVQRYERRGRDATEQAEVIRRLLEAPSEEVARTAPRETAA